MKLSRRRVLGLAGAAVALPAVSRIANAQAYPSKPIRLVIGYTPGGSADMTARLMGQWLSERLGQTVVIENRPGAGTNLATETVVRAPADGYTVLLVAPANAINATLFDKLNHNFMRDIMPVAGINRFSNVMEVHPSVPAKTVPEFIAYAKANPGKLSMASSGAGSTIHLSGELFKMLTGVQMTHVPYRGSAPALTDMISGQVHVMFDNIPTSLPHIRAGNAGRSDPGRLAPRLRSQRMVRARRAARHAGGGDQQAQRNGKRDPCRPRGEETVRGSGCHADLDLAGRLREIRGRRNREVGQGGEILRREAGLTTTAASTRSRHRARGRPAAARRTD
jgi:hypothetical protein